MQEFTTDMESERQLVRTWYNVDVHF